MAEADYLEILGLAVVDLVKDPNPAESLTRSTTLKSSCHKALARNTVAVIRGSTPAEAPVIFERLGIDAGAWSETVKDFGRLFKNVAGKSTSIEQARSLKTRRKFYRARV